MSNKIKFNIVKNAGSGVNYPAGTAIFRKGDAAESLYFIASGNVDIVLDGKVFDQLEQGEIFGEMGIIDRHPRSADAIAGTDCSIVTIDEARFLYMIQHTPVFALQMMRLIANRLRQRMAGN